MYWMYSHIKSSPRTLDCESHSKAQFVTKRIYCIVLGGSFLLRKRNSTPKCGILTPLGTTRSDYVHYLIKI